MRSTLIISFLIVLAVDETTAVMAYINDAIAAELNATCVAQHHSYNVADTTFYPMTCLKEVVGGAPLSDLCSNVEFRECLEKFQKIISSCLPEDVQIIWNQIIEIHKYFYVTSCLNQDHEQSGQCPEIELFLQANSECKKNFEKDEVNDLRQIFSVKNCMEYKKMYECIKVIPADCPKLMKQYSEEIRIVAESTLCNEAMNP